MPIHFKDIKHMLNVESIVSYQIYIKLYNLAQQLGSHSHCHKLIFHCFTLNCFCLVFSFLLFLPSVFIMQMVSYGSVNGTLYSILLPLHSWLLFIVITCLHLEQQRYLAMDILSHQQIFANLFDLRCVVCFPLLSNKHNLFLKCL